MATGMITRHFDHPSGATATLEMPAGWSRNSYYVLTMKGDHGTAPERVTCATPEEARQRAVERERHALASGWRPRVAARHATPNEITVHGTDGRRLPVFVDSIKVDGPDYVADQPRYTFLIARTFMICAHGETGDIGVSAGDRMLVRYRASNAEQIAAAVVKGIDLDFDVDRVNAFFVDIEAEQVAMEIGDQTAIERFHDREQVILDLIDDPDPSVMHLYDEISKRVQGPDRVQVHQEILRRRAERQAAEAREIEQRAERDRQEALDAVRAMQAATRLPAAPRRQQPLPVAQQDVEAAMRRLSGGQDFKPKRRKIDLGE